MSTVEAIRIEAPDASSAAYLMQELFGSFPAELIQDDRGSWEIVVQSGPDLPGRLSELLGVVQRWVDSGDTNAVTIRFGDREHTMGPRIRRSPADARGGPGDYAASRNAFSSGLTARSASASDSIRRTRSGD